jgi:hypothetical protein
MKTPQENISASITQLNLDPSCKLADKKSLEGNIDNFFQGKETPIQDKKKDIENKSQVKIGEERKRQGSRPKTAYKKPNQDYVGRDDKIDADLYYRVRDENDHLKKHQYQLNDEIKRITTALEKVKHGVLLERKLSDRKVIQVEGGFDVETETLKMENEKLQDKIKKMSTIIKGMQSQSVQNAGKSLGRKSLINAKTSLENQSEKNEYLKMINHLRELLKQSDSEVKRLSLEINSPNKAIKNMTEFNKDLRDKNSMLSEIQTKYEKTQMQFETNIKILEHTKQSLEDYISKYNEERKKNLDLENRIHLMEANLAKMPEYVSLIDEYKRKERNLEDRIKDLCENPFIKQAEERGNVYRKLQENELSLNEATRRLKNLEDTNKTLDKENKVLKEQYNIANIDRDKFKEEAMRFRISNEEKERQTKHFEDQFKLLGQYGEVDSNFTKILNILKLKDDNTSWMKIDFLEKMNEPENKDPVYFMKEIERLKLEKGMLGAELEKTKSLLQIQQQINEDQMKLTEEDKKILKLQNDKLMKKCEELAKLIDIERLPHKENMQMLKSMGIGASNNLSMDLLRKDLLGVLTYENAINMMSDTITEFSKDETETEFGMNENALDVYIGEAFFEEGLEKELGFKLANIMSFACVDFYLHETQTTNLISGSRPVYNLQLSFKVVVDEHFIYYLESDSLLIDIYYVKDNVQALLGKGKLPLSELIKIENGRKENELSMSNSNLPSSRVVNGVCQLYYAKDSNLLIGSVHYKMRMRQPLLEIVKWYKERNNLIREISPVHDVMMKKVEKELISMNNLSKGKVMSVTILITKATGLKVTGAPRKISPYVYYQFFKFDDHFTETLIGNDPLFQDVMKFDVVYDNSFHNYIEKETLDLYILDNSRPLEVEMKNDENKNSSVNLIDNPEYEDLIGICKVPLRDLIINDLIQNSFPIYNKKNQIAGEVVLNIFWEQVAIEEEGINNTDRLPYEAKTWEDALIIKLSELMKNKGLNLNSGFEIFDRDNKQCITLLNFKDIILFTFKFTTNQQELENLTEIVFKGRTSLTKLDFYKIFAMHLPHEGPMEDLLSRNQSINNYKKSTEIKVVENISISLGPETKFNKKNSVGPIGNSKEQSNLMSKQESRENLSYNQNLRHSLSTSNMNNMNVAQGVGNSTNLNNTILVQNQDLNRSMKDIVALLNDYMLKTKKSSVLEVYKMFDKDADLRIGKDVR